jgi:cbb3-type cytochrome oxidase maturation protein
LASQVLDSIRPLKTKDDQMNILYLLIGVSLFAALIFLAMFIWAVKTGQYDDNYTPSIRILFEDEEEEEREEKKD